MNVTEKKFTSIRAQDIATKKCDVGSDGEPKGKVRHDAHNGLEYFQADKNCWCKQS